MASSNVPMNLMRCKHGSRHFEIYLRFKEKAEVEMALATAQLDDEKWRCSVEMMEEMARKKNADVEDAMIVEYADSKQNVLIEACTNALSASKMKKLSI